MGRVVKRGNYQSGGTLAVGLLTILMWAGLMSACGVKTDPVPPNQAPPPAVADLTGELEKNRVTLTWSVPPGDAGAAAVGGFRVLRAKEAITDDPCQDCSPRFFQVRDLAFFPVSGSLPEGRDMVYSEDVEKGFIYKFKVVAYSPNGVEGEGSNEVVFENE